MPPRTPRTPRTPSQSNKRQATRSSARKKQESQSQSQLQSQSVTKSPQTRKRIKLEDDEAETGFTFTPKRERLEQDAVADVDIDVGDEIAVAVNISKKGLKRKNETQGKGKRKSSMAHTPQKKRKGKEEKEEEEEEEEEEEAVEMEVIDEEPEDNLADQIPQDLSRVERFKQLLKLTLNSVSDGNTSENDNVSGVFEQIIAAADLHFKDGKKDPDAKWTTKSALKQRALALSESKRRFEAEKSLWKIEFDHAKAIRSKSKAEIGERAEASLTEEDIKILQGAQEYAVIPSQCGMSIGKVSVLTEKLARMVEECKELTEEFLPLLKNAAREVDKLGSGAEAVTQMDAAKLILEITK